MSGLHHKSLPLVTFISPHISAATPFTTYANVLISPTRNVSFIDSQVRAEDLIAEGDKVVERFSFQSTNKGSFNGTPPTGKHVTTTGMSIFRIANDKLVEHWGENDALGVMQQLGMVPMSGV